MKSEHLKYATSEVPRYTSYPTAAQFGELGEPQYLQWLGELSAINLFRFMCIFRFAMRCAGIAAVTPRLLRAMIGSEPISRL